MPEPDHSYTIPGTSQVYFLTCRVVFWPQSPWEVNFRFKVFEISTIASSDRVGSAVWLLREEARHSKRRSSSWQQTVLNNCQLCPAAADVKLTLSECLT